MKILELRFKNLNSLYGEWSIDFTHPEYSTHGVFALTGPTGAGKSTVLDAICLALYGATPRLGKITASSNEIMSRHCGECSAEVLFVSQAGTFRCFWAQRRARGKAQGALQEVKHEIVDAVTQKIVEDRKKHMSQAVEEKTGMDFDRFTRSILLAQGGFDTFLKAAVVEKSKILEQITGTEIYTEISQRVHERHKAEQEALSGLQRQTEDIILLGEEKEQEIKTNMENARKQEQTLGQTVKELQEALAWLSGLENLQKDLERVAEEIRRWHTEAEFFLPQRARLEKAVKAMSLEGAYAMCVSWRKEQADDTKQMEQEKAALLQWEAKVTQQAHVLHHAEQKTKAHKEALEQALPCLQKVRWLDQSLAEQNRQFLANLEQYTKEEAHIAALVYAQRQEEKKQTVVTKLLEKARTYVQQHAHDAWLVSGFAGIKEQCGLIMGKIQEQEQNTRLLQQAEQDVLQKQRALNDLSKQCAAQKNQLLEMSKVCATQKEQLAQLLDQRLLREYRQEKESLLREQAYIKKIEALESYRSQLEDGKACPLCGATEHPFAKGNTPTPDAIEQKIQALTVRITQAEDLEQRIQASEKAEQHARMQQVEGEKQYGITESELHMGTQHVLTLRATVEKLHQESVASMQDVLSHVGPLGIHVLPTSQKGFEAMLKSLKARQEAWENHSAQQAQCEKDILAIGNEIQRQEAIITTKNAALHEKKTGLAQQKAQLTQGKQERVQLFGEKDPNHEERILRNIWGHAEEQEKQAREQYHALQQSLSASQARCTALTGRMEQRTPQLQEVEEGFVEKLLAADFLDEQYFLDCRLMDEERALLASRAQQLDTAKTELDARQKDNTQRLAQEREKKLTQHNMEEVRARVQWSEESLQQQREILVQCAHVLQENTAAKVRIQEKHATIDAQKVECQRWEKLRSLIGSADGKKFRNFAQGLTFELMVSHANGQLAKMTDRYRLVQDVAQPLELNVIDSYQAGEVRSIKNLSGGESFIISLTLALGLSKMSSRKVRVDSLFLDEGFGSLDEETLEIALETLSSLHQDGKLIGVISHVAALKDRISTQIHISPVAGGRSIISGPGCAKVCTTVVD